MRAQIHDTPLNPPPPFPLASQLEWICWSDVRFLDRFIADQNSYLVVSFRDGRKDHVRGPASLFLDPVVHKAIAVEAAVSVGGGYFIFSFFLVSHASCFAMSTFDVCAAAVPCR